MLLSEININFDKSARVFETIEEKRGKCEIVFDLSSIEVFYAFVQSSTDTFVFIIILYLLA